MLKMFEKNPVRQLKNAFANEASILANLQSVFRTNHNTCTVLTNLFSYMIEVKD